MDGAVVITSEEYKDLLDTATRVKMFVEYVKQEKYAINRSVCGQYLGFEVKDNAGES